MSASSDRIASLPVTSVLVKLVADLHARPAGKVARVAGDHDADIALIYGDRTADSRSVLAVMGLGAQAGDSLELRGSGPDAPAAAAAIALVLETAE